MQPSLMPSARVLAISQCRRVAAVFLFRLEMPAQVPEVGRVRYIVRGRSVSNLMKDSLLLFKCFLSGLKNVSADVKNGAIRGGHNPVGVGAIVDLCLIPAPQQLESSFWKVRLADSFQLSRGVIRCAI